MTYTYCFLVPSKGPSITDINLVTATSIKITWKELDHDDANGGISNYTGCYKASDNSSDVDCTLTEKVNASNTTVNLKDLNEKTTYVVAVQARTSNGLGKLGMALKITIIQDNKFIFTANELTPCTGQNWSNPDSIEAWPICVYKYV